MKHKLITLTNISARAVDIPGSESLAPGASAEVPGALQDDPEVKLRLQKSVLQITGNRIFDDEEEAVDVKEETKVLNAAPAPEETKEEPAEPEEKKGLLSRIGEAITGGGDEEPKEEQPDAQ